MEPVEGPDGVIFPATYAAAEGSKQDKEKFQGGYNIDVFPDKTNVCLLDSVGSQANRIEPIFARPAYSRLVPQIVIKAGDKMIVNLLDAGHRAGDAIVRFSKVGESIWEAFQALLETGNAEALAKIAPTSLVFGVWDSRGTQAKVPRAFRSVIRAHSVREVSRSAQFNRAIKYVEEGVIAEALDTGEGDKNPLSREGMKDSPATGTHGGVFVDGEIRHETTINLSAIRRLRAGGPEEAGDSASASDLGLRRYILGLSLVAGTAVFDDRFDLREGCQLRRKPGHTPQWMKVPYVGPDEPIPDLDDTVALAYASAAAEAFGVGDSGQFVFDKAVAEKWLALKKEEQEKRRRNGPMTKQFEPTQEASSTGPTNVPASTRRGRRPSPGREGS
jgi:CRISPR-associated protein Csb1